MTLPSFPLRAVRALFASLSAALLLMAGAPEPANTQDFRDRTPRVAVVSAFAPELDIRKAFDNDDEPPFGGPAEADETWFGGKRANMSKSKRKALSGRGSAGKDAAVGIRDRATGRVAAHVTSAGPIRRTSRFVAERFRPGARLHTDEARAYRPRTARYDHEAVNHSVGEFVRDQAHTNGIESFWSILKRAHNGVFHKISPKHLHRYVAEFAVRHNVRDCDTIAQMVALAGGMAGKRLTYKALIADNGLAPSAGA